MHRWTGNIYSIFRDKLLLLGEHVHGEASPQSGRITVIQRKIDYLREGKRKSISPWEANHHVDGMKLIVAMRQRENQLPLWGANCHVDGMKSIIAARQRENSLPPGCVIPHRGGMKSIIAARQRKNWLLPLGTNCRVGGMKSIIAVRQSENWLPQWGAAARLNWISPWGGTSKGCLAQRSSNIASKQRLFGSMELIHGKQATISRFWAKKAAALHINRKRML